MCFNCKEVYLDVKSMGLKRKRYFCHDATWWNRLGKKQELQMNAFVLIHGVNSHIALSHLYLIIFFSLFPTNRKLCSTNHLAD